MQTNSLRRFCVASLAALGCLGLVACSSPEERLQEHVQEGQRLLDAGQHERAALHFRNALRIEPSQPMALLGMGEIFEQRQDFVRAFVSYRDAAAADPALLEAHSAYAVLALSGGDLELVREAADSILAAEPENTDGLALEAALALREERLDDAVAFAEQALRNDPSHLNATSALVGAARAGGDAAAAIAVIDEYFVAIEPSVPLALLKLQLVADSGNARAVEDAFRELLAFDSANVPFRIAFADFYRGLGDVEAAESVLRTTIDELDTPPAAAGHLVRLVRENSGVDAALVEVERLQGKDAETDAALIFLAADMLAAEQRFDEAETQLQGLLDAQEEGSPRAPDAMVGLATVDYARGDTEAALSKVQELVDKHPEHRGANYLLAALQLQRGEAGTALNAARAALATDPEWVPALKLSAQAHLNRGDTNLAIEALQHAVQSDPTDLEAASGLAQLLTHRGDNDAALRVWDLVINQTPDASGPLATTAEIAIRQENWNRAATDIDRLLATPGAELSGTLLAGSLQLARGDSEGAREWFGRAQTMDPAGAAPLLGLVRSDLVDGNEAAALTRLEERVATTPGDALTYSLMAELHGRADRLDEAANAYGAAIVAQPGWATPYLAWASLEEGAGRVDEALVILSDGIAAGADTDGQVRLGKAFIQQRAGRYTDAIETYRQLLDAGDTRDLVINNYAALVADFAYEDETQLAHALELAERFEVSSTSYYLDTLGWLYYRQGDYSRALAFLRRAAALLPEDAHIRYHVGAAFYALGEPEAARRELELALPADADYIGAEEARALLEQIEQSVVPAGAAAPTVGEAG